MHFIDGQLSAEETRGIMGHVDDCPACLTLLIMLQTSGSLPGAGPIAALPGPQGPQGDGEARPCIGGYSIVRLLGGGGMGLVFEGVQERIGRRVAIKLLHAGLAQDPRMVARFLNEARAANLLSHPGIVGVSEFGQTPEGVPYLIMEFLSGESLRERLRRLGRLGPEALRMGRQIASTLAKAHELGIVHRDLKPDNVMLVPDPEMPEGERVKVLDFGLAKIAAALHAEGSRAPRTRSGLLLGTPAYMAPEQCRGAPDVSGQADVYALGVMLYEMLAGQTPFTGTPGELVAMHQYEMPPQGDKLAAAGPDLPRLIQRMLAKAPSDRPEMAEVAAALERIGGARRGGPSEESHARPGGPGTRTGLLLLGAAGLLLAGGAMAWRIGVRQVAVQAAAPAPVVRATHDADARLPDPPDAGTGPPRQAAPTPAPRPPDRKGPARPRPRTAERPGPRTNDQVKLLDLGK